MKQRRAAGWLGAALLGLAAVVVWQGVSRSRRQLPPPVSQPLLERALAFLQCPECYHSPLAASARDELVCPACNNRYPFAEGVLDMMPDGQEATPTLAQRVFQLPVAALAYDKLRASPVARLFTGHGFGHESAQLVKRLQVKDGKPVLDIACGPANFTAALARALPRSLLFGLDISWAQLRLARQHLDSQGLTNVLLVRGDAERLPFRSGVFRHVSNMGGLHQLPYLRKAVAEVARVLRPAGHFAGLALAAGGERQGGRLQRMLLPALAVNLVDMDYLGWLLNEFQLEGYDYERSRLIGYFHARKAAAVAAVED